jgi:hypothetical protein
MDPSAPALRGEPPSLTLPDEETLKPKGKGGSSYLSLDHSNGPEAGDSF